MKTKTLLACLLIATHLINSQEIVSTSGGEATGNGGVVSYSIGQLFYTSQTGGIGSVSEGVQQQGDKRIYIFNNAWSPSDPNGIATIGDDIIIEIGDAIINASTTSNTMTINPGAGLIVDSEMTLSTINGLILQSSSTNYSSLILNGSVTGRMDYERHVNINGSGTTGSNDLISPPLTGQAFNAFAAANPNILNNGTLYLFGPFEKVTGSYLTWSSSETATLDAGVGYRAATTDNSTLTFTGDANNGLVTYDITNSGPTEAEWNLVGNPYPSYLNVQDFLNHDVDDSAAVVTNLQLFDVGTAAIYGYDGNVQDGWTIYNLANTTASTLIAPGQGFFVSANANNAALYDLEFTPEMRSTGSGDDFIVGRQAELIYLKLSLSINSITLSTEFYFNDNASLGLDVGYDAELWGNTTPNFAIYSHLVEDNSGKAMTLQAINNNDISDISIPLGVHVNQGEQLTFSIADMTLPDSVSVYLEDVVANTMTLLNTSDYVISPTTTLSGTGRFFLRMSEDTLSTIDHNLDTLNIFALHSSKELIVSGQIEDATTIELYDIQGRKVLSTVLDSSLLENRINTASISTGVYVTKVFNHNQTKTKKVIIK